MDLHKSFYGSLFYTLFCRPFCPLHLPTDWFTKEHCWLRLLPCTWSNPSQWDLLAECIVSGELVLSVVSRLSENFLMELSREPSFLMCTVVISILNSNTTAFCVFIFFYSFLNKFWGKGVLKRNLINWNRRTVKKESFLKLAVILTDQAKWEWQNFEEADPLCMCKLRNPHHKLICL